MYSSLTRRSTGRLTPTRKLVKKGSSLRDLRPLTERVVLEKVIGVTVNGNSGLACNPVTGDIAYAAGCVIVIVGSPAQCQSYIVNSSRKTISSLAFSPDGKFLVSGESGHQPAVRIWDAEDNTHPQLSEMTKGHKHGIRCVAFSPNMKYVVSVGFQHDMLVNIWNWREGTTIACNKVSSKVSAISFSEKGDYFVTAGVRIVKFWYIDSDSATKVKKKIPLLGRPAILGEKRNNHFIDVACGVGKNCSVTYTVTKSGLLCSFNEKRLLDKWVELRVNGAYSLTVNENLIFCGCSDGIIRVFNSVSLQFIGTLPKPHCLGVDVAAGLDASHLLTKVENAAYPDTVAITLDHQNAKLTCIYNDHSIYIWDIKDIKKIGKVSSFLYHNSCIWGVEVYPEISGNYQPALPYGSFLTCSLDGTVRIWNIETGANTITNKNIYSKELMRVLYTEKELTSLKDTKGYSETSHKESETKPGVRCFKLCHTGQQLAVGDRMGNIRVFDLRFMDEMIKIEAHESEVLCIEYSTPDSGYKLLGSAGRDRLIHVFDCENNYNLLQTLDDHSASITSVRFNVSESKDFQLISCAADKSVIFRSAQKDPELQFVRYTNVATKTTFYDMDIHPSRNYAVTAGQDRNLRVYDISSGKQIRSFKGSMGDDGLILKVLLDRSGFYSATSCSDKSLCLYDFEMGECVAGMVGHSEIVTGLQFTVDCKRLITVSGDGCIFVWKLPSAFSQNMSERIQDHDSPKDEISPDTPLRRETFTLKNLSQIDGIVNGQDFQPATEVTFEHKESLLVPDNDYRFSMGKLPSWAKKQIANHESNDATVISETIHTSTTITAPSQPAGKWAERFNQVDLKIQPDSPSSGLDDSSEWKRITSEPNSLHEHIEALARTPLEKRCSDGSLDEEEFFFQDAKAVLRSIEKEHGLCNNDQDVHSKVTTSRGSDLFVKTVETRTYVESSLVQDTTIEQDISNKEEQDIIYYPTEEDLDSEVASLNKLSGNNMIGKVLDKETDIDGDKHSKPFERISETNQAEEMSNVVKITDLKSTSNSEIVKQTQSINQDHRAPLKKRTLEDVLRGSSESDEIGYFEIRPGHSMDDLVIHEVEFTSSGRRRSEELSEGVASYDVKVREDSDDDKDPESQNTESTSRDDVDDKTGDSMSDEEDLLTKEIIPKWDELSEEPAPTVGKADPENNKEFLEENFECLGSTPTQEKDEPVFQSGPEAVPDEPSPFDRNSFQRTSISARFIRRSKKSSVRSAAKNAEETSQSTEDGNTEEKKKQVEKRKEELASTKKCLEAMGFKAIDNWKNPPKDATDAKQDKPIGTETEVTKEEFDSILRNGETEAPPGTKPSLQAKETGDEAQRSPKAGSQSLPVSNGPSELTRLSSSGPVTLPAPLSGVPSSSPHTSTVAKDSPPSPSPSNITSPTKGTVEPITHKALSPLGSPNQSSFKVVKSPKRTIISSLEVSNIPQVRDTKKLSEKGDERTETRRTSLGSQISGKVTKKCNEADGEKSPVKRASELIAFFDPGQKHKPTKQETAVALIGKPETRTKNETDKSKSTKGDIPSRLLKHLRPTNLTLVSKSSDKSTTQNRRSFPASITRLTKNRNTERSRRSLTAKGDLTKAKSCGDLLHEQAKEEAVEERPRRRSECQEDDKAASILLRKESLSSAETSPLVENKISDFKLSELSAELAAAIANPAPQPIQLDLSRNYLLDATNSTSTSKHEVNGKERGFSAQITKSECREVVVDLVRAFERALECHSKILQGDIEDDEQQVLSMLSATFSTIQESVIECKKDREQKTRSPRARMTVEKPKTESITPQIKQTKDSSQQTEHEFSHGEHEKIIPLLEKYSELLLEKLDQKINK